MSENTTPSRCTIPLISIIIVNYNGKDFLQACLQSVIIQTFQDTEIIVVDNGSHDGSIEYIRESFPDTLLIPLRGNSGFSSANNEGLKVASGDYIMLLNNDVVMDKYCIANLCAAMEADPAAGVCAAKMLVHGTNIIDSAGDGYATSLKGFKRGEGEQAGEYNTKEYVFGACAGAALYRRRMLEEIGFLDENFFLIHEDTDLNFRAQLTGWKVLYVPTAVVYHKVRSTIGHMSDMAVYYTLRNSEFVRIKNVPFLFFMRCLPEFILGTISEFIYFVIKHRKLKLYLKAKMDVIKKMRIMLGKRKKIMQMKKVSNKYLCSVLTPIWNREFLSRKINKFLRG